VSASPPAAPPSPGAVALLLAANAVPLAGVLAWDWRVGDVVILYWIENVIIGLYNVLRILAVRPEGASAALLPAKLFVAAFFTVHYGMFCLVHGIFLAAMFPVPGPGGAKLGIGGVVLEMLREPGLLAAVGALVASHGASFVRNFLGRGEFRSAQLRQLMHRPYGRIVVVHVFIIGAGFLLQSIEAPVAALAVFVALKTAIDYGMHRRERSVLANRPEAR